MFHYLDHHFAGGLQLSAPFLLPPKGEASAGIPSLGATFKARGYGVLLLSSDGIALAKKEMTAWAVTLIGKTP